MVKIFLMEDNPADIALFEIGLQEMQSDCLLHVIRSTSQLIQALDQAKGNGSLRNKIVILDLFTPTNEGLEILRQIRLNQRFNTIPVLILTNAHATKVVDTAYDLGVNAFLFKPNDYEEFLKMIAGIVKFFGPKPAKTVMY